MLVTPSTVTFLFAIQGKERAAHKQSVKEIFILMVLNLLHKVGTVT